MPAPTPIDGELLFELYVRRGLTTRQVADWVGVGPTKVERNLAELGIPRRTGGRRATRRDPTLRPEDVLTSRYLTQAYQREGKSLKVIAEETGFSPRTVGLALARHGIPVRPRGGVEGRARTVRQHRQRT